MNDYSWSDSPAQAAFPIAKAGVPMILAGAFITAVFALSGLPCRPCWVSGRPCASVFFSGTPTG